MKKADGQKSIWEQMRPGTVLLALASLYLLGGGLLRTVGWSYDSASASNFFKIHPSTYFIALAMIVTIGARNGRVWSFVTTPRFLVFSGAALILLVRSIFIGMSGETNGELSSVLVTFVTPTMLLIVLRGMDSVDLIKLAVPLRTFFVINSLMALAERMVHHRFIPSFLDATQDDRAAALVSHPLNGSLLSGLVIVYLVTARRVNAPVWWRFPELALHTAAMFAFGGRSALVFTAMTVVMSAIMVRNQSGLAKVSGLQRALPFIILAVGIALMFLPIPFVDATLDRFANDSRSSETRNSAIQMLGMLSPGELSWGINGIRRTILMQFFGSDFGIELAWVALVISYGLLSVLPMMFALPFMMFMTARRLDRSALYMCVMFLLTTAGALSFGSKSTQISLLFATLYILCQPIHGRKRSKSDSAGMGLGLGIDLEQKSSRRSRSSRNRLSADV